MKDQNKTKAQLITELKEMRQRVSELEKAGTEQVQAKTALRAEDEFTDTALDAQLDTFFLFDTATNSAIRWNQSFKEISGYTDYEIARMPAPASYYSSEDLKKAEIFTNKVLEEGSGTIELELICKDGRRIPTEYRVSVINDDQGEPKYMISIGRDITERKQAEEALRKSERKYRQLFENMTSGFAVHEMIYDDQGKPVDYRYLEINPAFEKLTGVPVDVLLGKTVKEIMPNTENYWIETSAKVAMTGEPTAYTNFSRELDKYYDTYLFSSEKDTFAVVFNDVTEKVKAQEEVQKLN